MRQKTEKTPFEMASDAVESAGQVVHDSAAGTVHAVDETATAVAMAVGDAAKAAGRAVGHAMKATGEYMTQSKDTAVESAEETINQVEKKWLDLQAKAGPTADHAKADLQKAKDQMTQILADARSELVGAKDAGADAWRQNVKPALDADLQKAQQLYRDGVARFGHNQPA